MNLKPKNPTREVPVRRSRPVREPEPPKRESKRLIALISLVVIVCSMVVYVYSTRKPTSTVLSDTDAAALRDTDMDRLDISEAEYDAMLRVQDLIREKPYSKQGFVDELTSDGYDDATIEVALEKSHIDYQHLAKMALERYIDYTIPDVNVLNMVKQLEHEGFTDDEIDQLFESYDYEQYVKSVMDAKVEDQD